MTKPKPGWATIATASEMFGLTPQSIRQTYVSRLAAPDIDRKAKPMLVRTAAIIDLIVERRVEERLKPLAGNDPMMLAAGDSPGLERYRLAKAQLAEIDLAERRGEIICVASAKLVLGRWAALIRGMGERLGKRHGVDAAETVRETLAQFKEIIEPAFGEIHEDR